MINARSAIGRVDRQRHSYDHLFPRSITPGTHSQWGASNSSTVKVVCDLPIRALSIQLKQLRLERENSSLRVRDWEVCKGKRDSNERERRVVLKSEGIGLQDLAIARYAVSKAESVRIETVERDFHVRKYLRLTCFDEFSEKGLFDSLALVLAG
ncbi:hypothetical protein EV401DRAFT_1443610 [Pisolithus croceorrhizus]|nr:hypothetical protein EV401DRAFT_1443610 [Pisolithus croceorrhizus]